MTSPPVRSAIFQRRWTWWFMVAMLALAAAARLRLLNFPLERDEGEYAYAGQLILQGIPPYKLAYNMKFPGTYLAYAVIMKLFGETPAGIHFGVLLMTTVTAAMLYWLGKKMLDETAGIIAAASYAVMATSTAMFGYSAHPTHFAAFFATIGLCFLWRTRQKANRLMLTGAGISFGTAVLMIQHAAFIALWAGLWLTTYLPRKKNISVRQWLTDIVVYGAAVLLPYGLCCLWLWHAGVFGTFWFWTMDYAWAYISIIGPSHAMSGLSWSLHSIFSDCWLWWFAVAGLGVIWCDDRLRPARAWLFSFTLAAALTTVPGFYFRTHYFLLMLPAAALLAGCAVSGGIHCLRHNLHTKKLWPVPALAYGVVLTMVVLKYANISSVLAQAGGHALYGMEPVPESQVVAAFIRAHSPPSARIAVLGSEPQIYFYSHRHSATGYIYVYALMEPQPFAREMQHQMISEIETNTPEFIVVSTIASSWQRRTNSLPDIFNWWTHYQTNYDLVGLAEVVSLVKTKYYSNEEAARHGPLNDIGLEIYRRKIPKAAAIRPN